MFGKPLLFLEVSKSTSCLWRSAARCFTIVALSILLVACGSSSSEGGSDGADVFDDSDAFVVPLSVTDNDSAIMGSVDWERLTAENLDDVMLSIPEDSSLSLFLGSTANNAVVISSLPEFGAAVIVDDRLEYTPNFNFFGDDRLRVVRDAIEYQFIVNVIAVNDMPIIIDEIDRVAEQGVPFTSLVRVRNVDQDQLTFSSSNLPDWLTLQRWARRFTGQCSN